MTTNDEIRAHLAASIEQAAERTREIPEIQVTELVALRAENARLRARVAELEEELEREREAAFYDAKEQSERY